jgi:hypothetical protein
VQVQPVVLLVVVVLEVLVVRFILVDSQLITRV